MFYLRLIALNQICMFLNNFLCIYELTQWLKTHRSYINFISNVKRIAVRLGEYDISTTTDGKHETIRVDRAEKHKQFHLGLGVNDIALVYLVNYVNFTERISPICLPVNEVIKNHKFAGLNPFLAGMKPLLICDKILK